METDQERLSRLTQRAKDYAEKRAEELQSKVASLRARIEKLHDEKSSIERGLISKAEAIYRAKAALEKGKREFFIKEFLTPHLRSAQQQKLGFLDPATLQVHYLERQLWRFVFTWINASMIEEAGEGLEDDGPPEKERKAKIEGLNREIQKLEKEIEGLLE